MMIRKSAELCELMAKLFTCPSSSAGLERVFSSFGLVHTKLRNKLANAKVEKLVKIYVHLRCEHEQNNDIDNIDYVSSLITQPIEIE